MKNILCLTDFSDGAERAINYACTCLKDRGCNYFLLHVNKASNYTTSHLMSGAKSVYESVVGDYKNQLKTLSAKLEHTFGETFTTIIDYDNFIDAIRQVIVSYNIDLVVAGYNGASDVNEIVFGSNTLNVIRHLKTPSLIIPDNAEQRIPKHVLHLLEEQDSLKEMLDNSFVDSSVSSHFIRVITTNNQELPKQDAKLLEQRFNNHNYQYQVIYNIPIEHVKSYAMQIMNFDLTVLMVKEVSFFKRLFGNNATTKISKSLKKPLLVLH